jgi:hypothetical protein
VITFRQIYKKLHGHAFGSAPVYATRDGKIIEFCERCRNEQKA